ncbi:MULTISPECIES: (d)CMP kinase [Methylococcus]|jgi:cytidylate kinase|uniref:Cytidylate kinase n=2 Tax=Methylococcus capsulatus TaxID=414 RepID=KCY_METCA|nr:(d)CMP kinase [Methylococcus capsulatus]Q608S6.1 RecName: Full=Cytidylate kinase; Short=CK; AltName: Full=Cytidine monophosphate kinase; Short=CMP kinase [Methylococcus capsulatus str. Bath]AAU92308.1 cytidylate kinase [Methylococcus capsulatus str. Bath]QXP90759.1 (d)CMP kinase [Methylococcus capsulatus]CAI8888243.1 cytidylate kinase [Methylococcus capsulatus]
MQDTIPVLTIDGPSGAGKGTAARAVAARLGWNFLDSGAIYRALAVAAVDRGVSREDESALAALAASLDLVFGADSTARILLWDADISGRIVTEECGNLASKLAAFPAVRQALLDKQRGFRRPPGLVADGRDMGTVVFPDAPYKVFLTASAEVRARRRYNQLKEKGMDVSLAHLTEEIEERDRRDRERQIAPLRAAADAVVIDSSDLSVDEVIQVCLSVVQSH